MTRRSAIARFLVLGLICLALLGSCNFYNRSFPQDEGPFDRRMDFVVQVDDYGSFWEPEVAQRLLHTISENVQRTNVAVVVFIHGWHQNAQTGDDNAQDFAKLMRSLRERMDDNKGGVPGIYRKARLILTGN